MDILAEGDAAPATIPFLRISAMAPLYGKFDLDVQNEGNVRLLIFYFFSFSPSHTLFSYLDYFSFQYYILLGR